MDARRRESRWATDPYSLNNMRLRRQPIAMWIRFDLFFVATLAFVSFAGPISAQVPDIWAGPRDVLYVQTELNRAVSLYLLSSKSGVVTEASDRPDLVFPHE